MKRIDLGSGVIALVSENADDDLALHVLDANDTASLFQQASTQAQAALGLSSGGEAEIQWDAIVEVGDPGSGKTALSSNSSGAIATVKEFNEELKNLRANPKAVNIRWGRFGQVPSA